MGVSGGGGTFCPSSSSSEPWKAKQWQDPKRGREATTSLQLNPGGSQGGRLPRALPTSVHVLSLPGQPRPAGSQPSHFLTA